MLPLVFQINFQGFFLYLQAEKMDDFPHCLFVFDSLSSSLMPAKHFLLQCSSGRISPNWCNAQPSDITLNPPTNQLQIYKHFAL